MRKLILPLLLLTAMLVQSQNSEMFNNLTMERYNPKKGEWVQMPVEGGIDYIITMNLEKHTLLITRSKDDLNMEFIQVSAFVNKRGGYTLVGLLVDENRNTFAICGAVYKNHIEINFGELIYTFNKEVYSGQL